VQSNPLLSTRRAGSFGCAMLTKRPEAHRNQPQLLEKKKRGRKCESKGEKNPRAEPRLKAWVVHPRNFRSRLI